MADPPQVSLFVYGVFRKDILVKLCSFYDESIGENIPREFVQLLKGARESSLSVCQVFSTRSICKYLKRIYVYMCVRDIGL